MQNSWHCAHIRSCGCALPTLKIDQLEFVTTISTPILWRKHSRNGASYTEAERYESRYFISSSNLGSRVSERVQTWTTSQEQKAQCMTCPVQRRTPGYDCLYEKLLLTHSWTVAGSKKPNAKANQAAKATLKGVRPRITLPSDERQAHKMITGPRTKGSQSPQIHHLPQTQDPRSLPIAQVPSQVYSP